MARSYDIDIKGGKQVRTLLNKLPTRVNKKIVRASLKKAVKPIVKDAKASVPKQTGRLKRSIGSWVVKNRGNSEFKVAVGPRQSSKHAGYHGHLVEFGTDKMPAQPYLQPALKRNGKNAVSTFRQDALARIEKEAKKMAKTGKIPR